MAEEKPVDLKENKDPDSGSMRKRPHLPVNCVNLTLFNHKQTSESVKELPFKRKSHYDLPSSPKLNLSMDRKYKSWLGENTYISGVKMQTSYTAGKTSRAGENVTLPHIPTLRFYTGIPKSVSELPSNHSNGRQVNLALRHSTNGNGKSLYSQRQATAMDLRVVKTPLDSLLCVSTWNYCMPLSARELQQDTDSNSNTSPQRSPRYGHLAY